MKLSNSRKYKLLLFLLIIITFTIIGGRVFWEKTNKKLIAQKTSYFAQNLKAVKSSQPVFKPSIDERKWDSNNHVAGNCMVKNNQNETFLLYYSNYSSGSAIGLAKETSKGFERVSDNPVLSHGKEDEWDGGSVSIFPNCVIQRMDGTYMMYYSGTKKDAPDFYWNRSGGIGVAFSKDLINWTKYEKNPILVSDGNIPWESEGIFEPSIIFSGNEFGDVDSYKMWYGGNDKNGQMSIGYAESHDGFTWKKYQTNPVLKKSDDPNDFDGYTIEVHSVIKRNNGYLIVYEATDKKFPSHFRIGSAFSKDGKNWVKNKNNPILEEGPVGSWDSFGAYHPSLVFDNDRVIMYYVGLNNKFDHQIGKAEVNPIYILNNL